MIATMALLCVLAGSSGAAAGDTTRVSVDSSGNQAGSGSIGSSGPSVSADGRYVSFTSRASDLVGNDTNGFIDVFVHDRTTGVTQRVNVDSSGTEANGQTFTADPIISANGRYVAFYSGATNLVANDTNGKPDLFVHDLQTGTNKRANVDSSGNQADENSYGPLSISADGRYVVFSTWASNLVANDNTVGDVLVHDLETGATRNMSVAPNQSGTNGSAFGASMSADGRYVTFYSTASNVVANDTNNAVDVFVRDRDTDADEVFDESGAASTQRIRVDCAYSLCGTTTGNRVTSISADGSYVAFGLPDSNLVPGDTNGVDDGFVHDRQKGTTQRVSVHGCGTQSNGGSSNPRISANGRYVAFGSFASNLVSGDTNGLSDVFVRDLQMGTTQRESVDSSGTQANGTSGTSFISTDGSYVVFSSGASNLVANDTNDISDVFLHERQTGTTQASECIVPTSTASATTNSDAPYLQGTWTAADVKVSLSAQDNEGGSGIKELTYSATGAQPITTTTVPANQLPTQLPLINAVGTTTISYFAIDNAGNRESPAKTFTVKIDKSAPSVSAWAPTGTRVARGTNAQAFFSERVNPDSVTTSTFKLFRCSSTTSTDCATQITNVALTNSPDGLSATLNPFGSTTTKLAKRTKYKVVVTTGVTDEAGNRLDQNTTTGNQQKVWYFTTGTT